MRSVGQQCPKSPLRPAGAGNPPKDAAREYPEPRGVTHPRTVAAWGALGPGGHAEVGNRLSNLCWQGPGHVPCLGVPDTITGAAGSSGCLNPAWG